MGWRHPNAFNLCCLSGRSLLLIRPDEVSIRIAYATVLKVGNNPLWFLLGLSPSVDFGSGGQRKSQVLTEFVAARASRSHVLHLLHAMQTRPQSTGTIRAGRAFARRSQARSGVAPRCLWCPTSSASPVGRKRWGSWPSATKRRRCVMPVCPSCVKPWG